MIVPSESALIELEDAKVWLNIEGGDKDDLIQDLINVASDYAEWHCNRRFKARQLTNLRLAPPLGCALLPPAVPIVPSAPVVISLDGAPLTVWRSEGDGDPVDYDVIVLGNVNDVRESPSVFYRAAGWAGGGGSGHPQPILLSYTGGFVDTPGELAKVIRVCVQQLYRMQDKQTTDLAGYTSPVGGNVSFAPELVGSLIPMDARRVLDTYRWVPL